MHQTLVTPTVAPETAKKRRSRRRRYIIFGSIGVVLLLIIIWVIASKREKPIPVTTEKAVRKTILQTVSATGKAQPETEVKISPEVAGEIIDLPVEDGKAINKGDLLVRIKPDSYKALLEQQEAAISSAKATNLQQKATMQSTISPIEPQMICFLRRARRCFAVSGARAGVLTVWCIVGPVLGVKASGLVGCWTLANEIPFMIALGCSEKGLWIQLIATSFVDSVR